MSAIRAQTLAGLAWESHQRRAGRPGGQAAGTNLNRLGLVLGPGPQLAFLEDVVSSVP